MNKTLLSLLFLTGAVLNSLNAKDKLLASDKPLFKIQISNGCWRNISLDFWKQIPEIIRKRTYIELCDKTESESRLKIAAENNIPVVFRVRSVFPLEHRPVMQRRDIEDVLKRYPNIRGIAASELMNARFTHEERDYVIMLMEIAAKHGILFIWSESMGGSLPFIEVGADKKLIAAIEKYKDNVLLVMEAVNGVMQIMQYSTLLGLHQSGIISQWGINPQLFYWYGSGFIKLGEHKGYRHGKREAMPASVHSQLFMYAIMSGAKAVFMGGERVPHYLDAKLQPTSIWYASLPFMEELAKGGVIPSREEVAKNIKIAIKVDHPDMVYVTRKAVKDGHYSIRVGEGFLNTICCTENSIPVKEGKTYTVSGWVYQNKANKKSFPAVHIGFMDYSRRGQWPYVGNETFKLKIRKPKTWQYFKYTVQTPSQAGKKKNVTHLFVYVNVSDNRKTEYFFDALSLKDENGKELLENGSFEKIDKYSGRPINWAMSFKKHNTFTKHFGNAGRFYNLAYNLHGLGDLFQESEKYGLIPLMPHCWNAKSGPLADKFVSITPWRKEKIKSFLAVRKRKGASDGVLLAYPGRLWMTSSLENAPGLQTVTGSTGKFKVTGVLPSSSHVLFVERGKGAIIIVSGRIGQSTAITVSAAGPFKLNGKAAVKDGKVYTVKLEVKHSNDKITQKFIVES